MKRKRPRVNRRPFRYETNTRACYGALIGLAWKRTRVKVSLFYAISFYAIYSLFYAIFYVFSLCHTRAWVRSFK